MVSSFLEVLRGLKEELAEFSEVSNQVESMKNLAKSSLDSDPKRPTGQASLLSRRRTDGQRRTDGLTMPVSDRGGGGEGGVGEIPLTLTTKV